jgi:hypothetical protein
MAVKPRRSPCWYDLVRIFLGIAEEVIRVIKAVRGL